MQTILAVSNYHTQPIPSAARSKT